MTLKELVMRVSFEELLPYLKAMIKGHDNSVYAFREAYDRLRLMEPNPHYTGKIQVEWMHDILNEEEKWISVSNMHDTSWEEDLAKEIIVANDIQLNLAELAMHCLWEITFYGFSPEQRDNTFDAMFNKQKPKNKYDVALDKLEDSIWRHQTPRKYRSSTHGMRCVDSHFLLHQVINCKLNRAKWKRKYRQERREAYLESMSMRQNLVDMLTVPGSSFTCSDVEFLMSVEKGMSYDYTSITGNAEGRLTYIADSMTKYQQLDLKDYDNAIVCACFSTKYPLDEAEWKKFQAIVRSHLKFEDIRFGTIQTDNENPEVEIKLLLNKLKQ